MTRTAYWKALAVTTATTYPYALLVSKLSRIQLSEFQPCSRRACTFIKIFGSGMVPTTFDQGYDVFEVVLNGDTIHSKLSGNFLKPLCPSFSLQQMQDACNGKSARNSIINPLHSSRSRHAYVWCIAGWWLSKILHDWLLLAGAHEYTTLRIGVASILFHLLAVCAAFLWSMGAVEVFLSPLGNGECACYYCLPELEAILAIGTPCLLFITAVRKLENVHRAPLVGDYLYYQQYDAPFRLADKSNAVSSGTLLVGSAHGYHQEEWQDQLDIDQLRCIYMYLLFLCYVVFLGVVSVCVGIGIGPVTARSIELILTASSGGGWILSVLLAVVFAAVWCFPAFLLFRLAQSLPIDWMALRARPELWEYHFPRFNLAVRVAWILLLASCLIWASWVLSLPMVAAICDQFFVFGPRVAWRCALAGIMYFAFGIQMFVWIVYLVPAHRALYVKARMPFRPSAYVEIGLAHPEFNLKAEVELAQEFLRS
ncbi:PDF1B [Symbiodinium natans]|uniref:PDF1B protein n=1 Tax=Symbiodinium natans TaxID=878477 RepID=A0A812N7L1_9DINO|nr:PDF1B [Symbiodinium natans]